MLTVVLIGLAAIVVLAALLLNVMATVSLYRTTQLSHRQKVAQAALVWLIPFIAAWLVLRLLAESDPDAVRRHWTPNDTINEYVYQALGIEARIVTRQAEAYIENAIAESFSSHAEHSSGGESGGADGGH